VTEAQRPGHRPRTGAPFGAFAAFIAGKLAGRALFRTGWVVLVRDRQPGDVAPKDLSGFRPIDAPTGRFYADPFVLAGPDGPTIYVEDCPDGTHRGQISSLRRDIDGRWGLERVVLADLEHRAYPHAIRTDESIVMTPDGGRHGGVDFFVDGPATDGLARVGQALEGAQASDPTVLWHDDRFWLFVTLTEHGMSPWDELHLFSSASITGLWHPHPRNPIVADVRSARPAGRIFRLGDRLVRPGQDCSVAYGHRIALSEITTLTADRYEERPMGSIEPVGLPGFQRTHTYTFDGTVEALDGYRRMVRRPGRQRRPS
jgi:hypothetical protein